MAGCLLSVNMLTENSLSRREAHFSPYLLSIYSLSTLYLLSIYSLSTLYLLSHLTSHQERAAAEAGRGGGGAGGADHDAGARRVLDGELGLAGLPRNAPDCA